jgi:PAS domain S-box-containing protein
MGVMRKQSNDLKTMRAEGEIHLHAPQTVSYTRPYDEILHELQAHQIELEIQNKTLRQSQIALEESRDRYLDFYDFAPIGYLTLNREGLITDINLTGATLLKTERNKLVNHRFALFIAPEDSELWHRHFMAVLQYGSEQTCELDIRPSLGTRLHVQLSSLRLVRDGTAPVVRIAVTDITQITLAGIALHDSETHLRFVEQREIIQTSLDGFWVVNTKNARILEVNDAFCSMLGYSRNELLTMCISDLEVDVSPDEIAACIENIMEIGYDRFETRHRHKKGHIVNLEVSVSLSQIDGGVFFVFARDITERKRADELLRNSYEEVRDLYNNAACGYHSLGKDGIFRRINDTELAWIGYTRDEVIGKMKWTDLLTPVSIQSYQNDFPQLMKQGFIHDIEAEIICKDGTLLVGLINATAIYDPGGNFVMTRSTIVDITERKRAEQLSAKLTAHLQTVREEERFNLAREIHDDLGSTLTALQIEICQLEQGLSSDQKIMPLFARVGSMAGLLDDAVRSTRRIITDLRPTIIDDYGLQDALKWQADEFQKRTGIECRVNCTYRENSVCKDCKDCKDCEYTFDKTLSTNLFRIFQESLTNVVRHSGASRVEAEFRPSENEVILSIRDNGCGLPEGHAIASTSYGIRGMRERVWQMGGEIGFDSQPGSGFSVTVTLPLTAATQKKF